MQLKTTLDKGWMAWAAQAAELHIYRADGENRRKEGRGFYKLNDESVSDVQTKLARNYQALVDQHAEELTQLLEEFGESQEEMFHRIMEAGSTRPSEEPIIVPDSDSAEQEEPPLTTPEITTTARNSDENTDTQPVEITHTNATELVERIEQGRTSPTTTDAEMRTPVATRSTQDALQSEEIPMKVNDIEPTAGTEHAADIRGNSSMSSVPDLSQQPEPTILDILEDE